MITTSKTISIKEFLSNAEQAVEWIKNNIRQSNAPLYEDGSYYFHFSVNDDTITVKDSFREAEYTVTTDYDMDSLDWWERYCQMKGINLEDITWETEKGKTMIDIDKTDFAWSDFEESEEFAEDFNSICWSIYDKIVYKL